MNLKNIIMLLIMSSSLAYANTPPAPPEFYINAGMDLNVNNTLPDPLSVSISGTTTGCIRNVDSIPDTIEANTKTKLTFYATLNDNGTPCPDGKTPGNIEIILKDKSTGTQMGDYFFATSHDSSITSSTYFTWSGPQGVTITQGGFLIPSSAVNSSATITVSE